MDRIYYKVCREENGRFYSATDLGDVVDYKINEWAFPRDINGPLTVFDTYVFANSFYLGINGKSTIFACKIIPSKKLLVYRWINIGDIKDYYLSMSLGCLPAGTVLADKVMLLEKI